MRPISFAEFLRTPELAGPEWQKPTRAPWHVLAKAISGERLTRSEVALLKACTGLERVPRNVRALILLIGRRGGKSHFLGAFAVWLAVFGGDWLNVLSLGERGVILLMGADRKQAQVLARYAQGLCAGAIIAEHVVRVIATEIEFTTGAVIEVCTNDHRTLRSRTCLAVIGDEACFWSIEDDGRASSDEEVVAAAEPSMATVPARAG